jgi:micrococcal nuclease
MPSNPSHPTVTRRRAAVGVLLAIVVPVVAACAPPQAPAPGVFTVERVIDGDTVDVGLADDVRLIGIDTPESGQCGFNEAETALETLVLGKQVTLGSGARTDRDRYPRYLRYIDVGGVDAQLALLNQGLAIARYDSRDGYGAHPREVSYIAADAAHPNLCGQP